MNSAISATGLTARYAGQPTAALFDIELDVQHGERLLLLGPNGAGKSTFIRVFAGLMRAERGTALVLGQAAHAARQLVGVVSHATYLYDELTVFENLRFYAHLYDVNNAAARSSELLARVELTHLADERVGRLSRGQQQRVSIARALLHDPPVLLLDEPDTGLDLAAFGLLEQLATESERSVVLTTHNLASGLRLGTRVCVLARGRLVYEHRGNLAAHAAELTELLERLGRA